jgi:hypothetical protein
VDRRLSTLRLLPHRLAVCRLSALDAVPEWATGEFLSITRTAGELSIVCGEELVAAGVKCEGGWRVFEIAGPLEFALTGVVAGIASPLAAAGVSIFAVSTFDTDYVLVKEDKLAEAIVALRAAAHEIEKR